MFWTPDQQAAATKEGWALFECIENGTTKPKLRVFGLRGVPNFKAQQWVLHHAKQRSQLHIDALSAISHSALYETKKGKK